MTHCTVQIGASDLVKSSRAGAIIKSPRIWCTYLHLVHLDLEYMATTLHDTTSRARTAQSR